jgi:hypothetical protein
MERLWNKTSVHQNARDEAGVNNQAHSRGVCTRKIIHDKHQLHADTCGNRSTSSINTREDSLFGSKLDDTISRLPDRGEWRIDSK